MLNKSILFTGMKHCGKSSTGRITAEALSCIFFDLDEIAEDIFFRETKNRFSTREIYLKGREIFQSFEFKAAEELSSYEKPKIAAAGGGFCDNNAAVAMLKNSFLFVYIQEDPEILYKRIICGGIPAFLSKDDPFNNFLRLYETRSEIYDKISDIKITAEGRTAEDISRKLVQILKEDGYAG